MPHDVRDDARKRVGHLPYLCAGATASQRPPAPQVAVAEPRGTGSPGAAAPHRAGDRRGLRSRRGGLGRRAARARAFVPGRAPRTKGGRAHLRAGPGRPRRAAVRAAVSAGERSRAERRGAAASSVVTHRGGPTRQGGTEGGAWAAPGEGPAASPRPGQRRRRRHHPRAGREEGAGPGWKGRDRSGGVVRRGGGGTWWKGAGPPATVDTGCSRALTCVQPFLQCRMSPRAPSFLLAVPGTAPDVLNQTNRVHVRPGEWLLS